MDKELIAKHIGEVDGQYAVMSQDKTLNLGVYKAKQQAMDRLLQIESFKKGEETVDEIMGRLVAELAKATKAEEKKVEEVKKEEAKTPEPEKKVEETMSPIVEHLNKAVSLLQAAIQSGNLPELKEVKEVEKPIFTTQKNDKGELEWNLSIPIVKINQEQQLVEGIVYEPDTVDAQGDSASAEEIQKAAHNFMVNARRVGLMHKYDVSDKTSIVESYLAKTNFVLNKQAIKRGTWMMVLKINDADIWKDIKDGKITGLSMGGRARAE